MKPGLLVTADGAAFRGRSVGAAGVATGEVVFNTAMTGYQEVVTDPSYAGQVVVMTSPHIGNYGVTPDDEQAPRPHAAAMVVRSMARRHSNWRARGGLPEYLAAHGVVALDEVDTRRLTRHVRAAGAMPAAVGVDVDEAELADVAGAAPSMAGRDLASTVTTPAPYDVAAERERTARVVAYDFGIKRDILAQMTRRGFEVTVVPAGTPATAVLERGPDGVFLSNGPGDPEPLEDPVRAVGELLGRVPIFGICLGHQILGRALGARTFKLPFGHHGGNHPVQRVGDGRVEITSQNHGFAVDADSLGDDVAATHVNLNDGTLEGLECRAVPAFSVQFHPEAAPGPHEAATLFDRFAELMGADPLRSPPPAETISPGGGGASRA